MQVVKILLMLAVLILMAYPLLPLPVKLRRFSTFSGLRYAPPHNKKNLVFIFITLLEFILIAVLVHFVDGVWDKIAAFLASHSLLPTISSKFSFNARVVVEVVIVNLVVLYGLVLIKGILKRSFLDSAFGLAEKKKGKKKKAKAAEEEPTDSESEQKKKRKKKLRIPFFRHSEPTSEEPEPSEPTEPTEKPKKTEWPAWLLKFRAFVCGIFYKAPDFRYARIWAVRVCRVLQTFIVIVEVAYFAIFLLMLIGVFYPGPDWMYKVLDFLTVEMYIYPFISLIFLQEICNTLKTESEKKVSAHKQKEEIEETEEEEKREASIAALHKRILGRFGQRHFIRYFPAAPRTQVQPYECTNKTYAGALKYIRSTMESQAGQVVESYMKGLDATFNGKHVYFSASFYSELGEYLIAYTYIRLLAGERQIFIVSDREKVDSLKKYIGRRLTELTGSSSKHTWRVRGSDARLDQTDVLIAVPEDFRDDNIVDHYPAFFEETCNAIFVDADRVLSLDSYLCPVMAIRLQKATGGRIRFLFLTQDYFRGFIKSLKKFFCIGGDIIECSSAKENENVAYLIWNREQNRVYEKYGQKITTPEGIVAEEAFAEGIDGIRILTDTPLDEEEATILAHHRVEINEFHKEVPRINYMICTDDRANLSAALYAYTRFRGTKRSVLHILCKPYLLREYFMARIQRYVNASSFIQPRVTEHANDRKLSLLRIFCDATGENEMTVSEFTERMTELLKFAVDTPHIRICPFCTAVEEHKKAIDAKAEADGKVADPLPLHELAGYIIAGLCDDSDTPAEKSVGQRARDYYLLVDPGRKDGFALGKEEYISFKCVAEVFDRLFACNDRVELRLNDGTLGYLDTFPSRVRQQYIPGQSIVYKNSEYEIDRISKDNRVVYLRQENVTFRNSLDMVHLRRYAVALTDEKIGLEAVYHSANSPLIDIRVNRRRASIVGETYGFYNLLTDSQTLDFVRRGAARGNPNLESVVVDEQRRTIAEGNLLSVRLVARDACNDGMRLLLAAVFNEFIRTIFPDAYRCIAVCPVLENPIDPSGIADNYDDHVRTLYPYLTALSGTQAEQGSIELLIINDCREDVGVLDLLYDGAARIMQELLGHIAGYLSWLKANPTLSGGQKHYIYFGAEEMPKVYDLDGCCALLADCEPIFDDGETDFDAEQDLSVCCSFCHKKVEYGRYSSFDDHRFICMDCEISVLTEQQELEEKYEAALAYLKETYPDITFPDDLKVAFDPSYELKAGEVLTEHYHRLDPDSRTIYVERDMPAEVAVACCIHGILAFWQRDNNLLIPEAMGQLYFEELNYLLSKGEEEGAAALTELLSPTVKEIISDIYAYIQGGEGRTSFSYLLEVEASMETPTPTPSDPEPGEEIADELYDPDRTPRFWKRYLRGEHATGSVDAPVDEPEDPVADADPDADPDVDPDADPDADPKADPKGGKGGKKKGGKRRSVFSSHQKTGSELIPHEEEEDKNVKIRLYNEIARHIADYDDSPIPTYGLSSDEVHRIFQFVRCDYPEFFWLNWYATSGTNLLLRFRCLGSDGKVDKKQVQKKRSELRQSVKRFTHGITRRTKPEDAVLTIYRRIVLSFDYEGIGLKNGAGEDIHEDDTLRSLYYALVKNKVVCAGYAVAMQYLLQSVGISCGYVTSDPDAGGGTHAFNALKIGRYCYYLDATWGDPSNTQRGDDATDIVRYDYFCVPLRELQLTSAESVPNHTPRKEIYYDLEEFSAVDQEYFRKIGAYVDRYDEAQLIDIFAAAAQRYDEKEMGRFHIAFRCSSARVMEYVVGHLVSDNGFFRLAAKAHEKLAATNKRAAKRLDVSSYSRSADPQTGIVYLYL